MIPTPVRTAAALLPVPRPHDVSADQLDGSACVWCARPLEDATAVSLGARLKPSSDVYWSPQACAECIRAAARRVLALHIGNCHACRPGSLGCGTRHLLRQLASLRCRTAPIPH
jgi:hypothetical protein